MQWHLGLSQPSASTIGSIVTAAIARLFFICLLHLSRSEHGPPCREVLNFGEPQGGTAAFFLLAFFLEGGARE